MLKTPQGKIIGAFLFLFPWAGATGQENREENRAGQWLRLSEIVGQPVDGLNRERLGKIEDVMLDASTGSIVYAVLTTDGVMLCPVPWEALQRSSQRGGCRLPMDRERMRGALWFDRAGWPNFEEPQLKDDLRRFFNLPTLSPHLRGELPAGHRLAGADLRRSGIVLPLALRQGTVLRYRVEAEARSSKQEIGARGGEVQEPDACTSFDREVRRDLEIRVLRTHAEETEVEVRWNERGGELTAVVAADGDVEASDTRLELLLRVVFGSGVHGTLEPGRRYAMGKSSASSLRFDGVATRRDQRLALFTVTRGVDKGSYDSTASDLQAAGPSAQGQEPDASKQAQESPRSKAAHELEEPPVVSRESMSDSRDGILGNAAYRTDDGALERLSLAGTLVRRLEPGASP
ncbi:MAG TPA: PRC-barrel domain-containing protein [Planctomycetota bacterium]|nr:PRC-barrel domain-containing protein [Planctomycetota bacterium]